MKTDSGRFSDTITYIEKFVSAELAQDIVKTARDSRISKSSLGGHLRIGSRLSKKKDPNYDEHTEQRHALRGLLLCHKTYLKQHYAVGANGNGFDYEVDPDGILAALKLRTETQLREAMLCYLPGVGASRPVLAQAALDVNNPAGWTDFAKITRTTNPFPNMPVCFDALKMLLFKAGFVSIRWLARTGPKMTAQTVNTMLGDGVVIEESELGAIPAGFMFNFHKSNDKAVCHWGVCLGGGWAAGANTSAKWPGTPREVTFRNGGNSFYGEFTLESSLHVCKYKYFQGRGGMADVTIRKIDPTLVTTYF